MMPSHTHNPRGAVLRKPREVEPGEHAALIATILGLPKLPEPQPEKKRA